MPTRNATLRPHRLSRLMTVLLAGALLVGCGSNPDEMVASAKDYLAQKDYSAATIQLKNALQEKGDLAEARYLLGRVYFDQGDYASAEKELSHAARVGFRPDEVSPLLAQAMLKLGKAKALVEAFADSAPMLTDTSARARVLTALGDARFGQSRDAATKDYRAALEADPDNALAALGLARATAADGNREAALAQVDAILGKHPEVSEAHVLRGQLLFSLNRTDDGLAALASALQHNPKDQVTHLSYVSTLLTMKRIEDAEAGLAAMKKGVGDTPVARYLQAYVDFAKGNAKAARDSLQTVQNVIPDFMPANLLAGAVYFRLNDQTQAQANLNRVLSVAPGHVAARRLLVMSYLAQRDAVRAKDAIAPLIAQYPDNAEVLSLAGQVYLLAGDFEQSSAYLGKLVTQQPEDSRARTRLGIAQLAQGNLERGLADLSVASELDETQGYADFAIVTTLMRKGEFDKALAANKALAKKVPDSPLVFNLEGGILLGKGDVAGARSAFEKALEIQPDFLAAATNLARLDLRDSKPDAASARFAGILAKNPKHVGAHLALAELAIVQKGDPAVIRSHLDSAIAAAPDAVAPRRQLIGYLLQTKQPKDALGVARELEAVAPDNPDTMRLLAMAQLATGDFEQAVANMNRLVTVMPGRADVLLDLARAQLAASDPRSAVQSLDKALTIQPEFIEARRLRVSLMLKEKQFDAGVASARELQKLAPKVADGFALEGDAEAARGEWAKALGPFRQAFTLAPSSTAVIKLHAALSRVGKRGEAETLQKKWLKDSPDDLPVLTYLAEQSLAANQLKDAKTYYLAVLRSAPDSAVVLNNLAWVADKLGDPEAEGYIARALALAPESPAVLDTAGMMEIQRGKIDTGLAKLEKAHQLAPDALAITINLAQSYRAAGKSDAARKLLTDARAALPAGSPAIEKLDALLAAK